MNQNSDYTHSFTTDLDPAIAMALTSDPKAWWNDLIVGDARAVGDTFEFDVPGLHHASFVVSQADPGQFLVWDVVPTHAQYELAEWTDTRLEFCFVDEGGGTRVEFTHRGLTPALECHHVCSTAWTHHLTAGLQALLNGGRPEPLTHANAAEVAEQVGADNSPTPN